MHAILDLGQALLSSANVVCSMLGFALMDHSIQAVQLCFLSCTEQPCSIEFGLAAQRTKVSQTPQRCFCRCAWCSLPIQLVTGNMLGWATVLKIEKRLSMAQCTRLWPPQNGCSCCPGAFHMLLRQMKAFSQCMGPG